MVVRLKNLIPELNLWFGNTLLNNDLTFKYINYPVKLSSKWRCRDSVIDLLFNECCDPSGNLYDGHHYIKRYKTLSLNRIYPYDATLYRRLQIVKNRCYVFACDDPENQELQMCFNLVTPKFVIDPTDNIDSIAQRAGVNPTKYVTEYGSEILFTGTDQLHKDSPPRSDPNPDSEPTIYEPSEDIFNFTEEELEMLEYLYYYRTGQFELIHCFPCDFYYKLVSPLSKWIYLYLQCYLFNVVNWEFLNTICDPKIHGSLRSMFEKYAQDRIYEYIQKQYYLIWNDIKDIGGKELQRIFEDHTMPCHTYIYRKRITQNDIINGKITIETDQENQPVTDDSFEFIYDGIKLKLDKDYKVINEGNFKNTHICIVFNKPCMMKENTKYHMMWSALKPSSPYTLKKGFKRS